MGQVVRFPKHKLAHCCHNCDGCCLCNGGLASCEVCGGAEGSLPTECPGQVMPEYMANAVYHGEIDYTVKAGWIIKSKATP